ncbi:MAG: cupin domain-containing protein, partial [Pseudomonadaceae bacterium]
NASDSEPAKLLAVFVVDSDDDVLTTPDGQDSGNE